MRKKAVKLLIRKTLLYTGGMLFITASVYIYFLRDARFDVVLVGMLFGISTLLITSVMNVSNTSEKGRIQFEALSFSQLIRVVLGAILFSIISYIVFANFDSFNINWGITPSRLIYFPFKLGLFLSIVLFGMYAPIMAIVGYNKGKRSRAKT